MQEILPFWESPALRNDDSEVVQFPFRLRVIKLPMMHPASCDEVNTTEHGLEIGHKNFGPGLVFPAVINAEITDGYGFQLD